MYNLRYFLLAVPSLGQLFSSSVLKLGSGRGLDLVDSASNSSGLKNRLKMDPNDLKHPVSRGFIDLISLISICFHLPRRFPFASHMKLRSRASERLGAQLSASRPPVCRSGSARRPRSNRSHSASRRRSLGRSCSCPASPTD